MQVGFFNKVVVNVTSCIELEDKEDDEEKKVGAISKK